MRLGKCLASYATCFRIGQPSAVSSFSLRRCHHVPPLSVGEHESAIEKFKGSVSGPLARPNVRESRGYRGLSHLSKLRDTARKAS